MNPAVLSSIVSSHSKGLNTQEIQACLSKETNFHVDIHTVNHYLHKLNLKLLVTDVESGNVTMDQLYKAVDHAQQFLLHNSAGYQRMRTILARQYSIRVPSLVICLSPFAQNMQFINTKTLRQLVYDVLQEVDPERMAA